MTKYHDNFIERDHIKIAIAKFLNCDYRDVYVRNVRIVSRDDMSCVLTCIVRDCVVTCEYDDADELISCKIECVQS